MAVPVSMQKHYDSLTEEVIAEYPLPGTVFKHLLVPMMRILPTQEAKGEQLVWLVYLAVEHVIVGQVIQAGILIEQILLNDEEYKATVRSTLDSLVEARTQALAQQAGSNGSGPKGSGLVGPNGQPL
jgi:hypothetical protein